MKRIYILTVTIFLLMSCTAPTPLATLSPTATTSPTLLPTIAPTETPIASTIAVDELQIPDPKFTNPEFFDLTNPDSPIVQFASAFGVKSEDVAISLHAEVERPANGNAPFVVLRTSDGVTLMMAQQYPASEEWKWEKAVPGAYWFAQGKLVGANIGGGEVKNKKYRDLLITHFQDGIVAIAGQVNPSAIPYRPPSNADRTAEEAQNYDMSLFFHYVAEPGKFPEGVNSSNIDTWLDTRLDGVAQLIKSYKAENHPMYIAFNEAWEGNEWNQDSNPLRDKYSGKWVEEYTYQLLRKFINKELVVNQDFVVVFNDANLYDSPYKQDLIFDTLSKARTNVFDRLISDSETKEKLDKMNISKAEDIKIILGVETHTQLDGKRNDGIFVPPPTNEQIIALSEKFERLGGIIMTEVNPNGSAEEQELFTKRLFTLLPSVPNLNGIVLWHIFSPNDPSDTWSRSRLGIFNENNGDTIST